MARHTMTGLSVRIFKRKPKTIKWVVVTSKHFLGKRNIN